MTQAGYACGKKTVHLNEYAGNGEDVTDILNKR